MRLRVLILGGSGFVGLHLQNLLQAEFEIIAPGPQVDVRDREALAREVAVARPEWVVHLAAISNVPQSFADPCKTLEINVIGTLNLLLALKKNNFRGNFLFVGSSQVYGLQEVGEPALNETRATRPVNPYAVSKLAAEALCYQWAQGGEFKVIMTRPFNHIGPGQSEDFAVPNFARQIIEIKKGLREPRMEVGNIDVERDFTDVRDVVRAYRLLLERGVNGESYNVCSGTQVSLRKVIDDLLRMANVDAEIDHGAQRFRSAEQSRMLGSAAKLQAATGWRPKISLEESLRSILDHYEGAIT